MAPLNACRSPAGLPGACGVPGRAPPPRGATECGRRLGGPGCTRGRAEAECGGRGSVPRRGRTRPDLQAGRRVLAAGGWSEETRVFLDSWWPGWGWEGEDMWGTVGGTY